MIRVGGVGHAEAGVGGGKALAVELAVAGHAQALEIHRRGHHLGAAAGLLQAPGSAGQVAAAGIGADHHIGMAAAALHKLMGQLPAQGLHAAYTEGGVEGGVEVAGLLQHHQHLIEQLRPYAQLQHLSPQSFALAGLLDDFRLAAEMGVIALLDDDALKALHSGLGGHRRAVIAAGGGDDALIPQLLGVVHRGYRPPLLKAAGRVGGLVLDEDPGALAGSGVFPGQSSQVVQLENRGIAHIEPALEADVVLQGIAGVVHHSLVVKGNGPGLIAAVIHAHGLLDNISLAAGDRLIALIHDHTAHHASSPPKSARRRDSSMVRISGTKAP